MMNNDLRRRRKEDQSSTSVEDKSKYSKKTFRQYVILFGILIILSVILFTIVNQLKIFFIHDETLDDKYYPSEILYLFRKHDRDNDNYLSIDEFEPIASQLGQKKVPTDYIQPILNTDQLITINAFFEPLNFSTITKDFRHTYFTNLDELQSLKLWKQPYVSRLNFAARHFKSFLPKQRIEIGKPYWIIEGNKQQFAEHLPSNRYYPPDVSHEHIIFHRLLSMFHPRPFIFTRFPPQGTVAVVRARHDSLLDIYFRIHAEFQLNTPPYHPFWYTPGLFQGRLIIRDDASDLTYFQMYVPNDKRLNVDMEWLVERGGSSASLEVDIGYMPRMELRSAAPSINMNETGITPEQLITSMNESLYDSLLKSFNTIDENFKNEKEIYDLLEKKFYPFKEVPYYEYRQAFKKAEETNKLVHTVVLWVLESSAVLNLLRENYISTWTLVVDLKAIMTNQSNDAIKDSQRAKHALDNYAFPVESMIQQIDGTVISKINANDLLETYSKAEQFLNVVSNGMDITVQRYVHFLEQALDRQK
ncbi:unnamed protein product [Rotaria sordida]|uniref:EF-hand domain-containing protein n=1 Tax=Rotaria sordida TaxID=392033 RepID=A0A818PWJ4_9BILA|nr:unnamed protein product [Rotaria sordida]CAF3629996.1 unnamed protein product [Rotaria sordida]